MAYSDDVDHIFRKQQTNSFVLWSDREKLLRLTIVFKRRLLVYSQTRNVGRLYTVESIITVNLYSAFFCKKNPQTRCVC